MKSHIDRKFTCFTFVGSGKRKKWMVGEEFDKRRVCLKWFFL